MKKIFIFLLLFLNVAFADTPSFTIKAGVLKNFPPYYIMSEDGKPSGFGVEVFELISGYLHATVEYKVYDTWPLLMKDFKKGLIDVIPNMGVTKERAKYTYFTRTIDYFDVSLFVSKKYNVIKNLKDLKDKKIGYVEFNVGEKVIKNLTNVKKKKFDNKISMMFAMVEKDIDAFIYPKFVAISLLKELNLIKKVKVLGAPLLSVERAIGVNIKRAELFTMINQATKELLQTAEFNEIEKRWLSQNEGMSDETVLEILILVFILFIFILLAMRYSLLNKAKEKLKNEVENSTKALHVEIEEHKKTEKLLKDSEERFRILFDKAPIPYQSLNEKGYIRTVNEAWLKEMKFKSKDEVIGKWFGDFLNEEGRKKFKVAFENFKKRGFVDGIEYSLKAQDGSMISVDFTGRIHNPQNDTLRSHCVFINKTESKKQEEMMLAQSRQAAMGEMIGMIAHQWRQPLAIMSMDINNIYADIEFESLDENDLKSSLQKISKQIMYLSETIDDFRNFFKPDKEKIQTTLDKILNDTLSIVGKSLANNNIEIIIDGSIDRLGKFFANELVQVFLNILNNAKDVLIEKKDKRWIKITLSEEAKCFKISFEDNGGGVSEKVIGTIFEPYVSTKSKNGTGLGLYMSKTIIEKHERGKLICKNTPNGASFIISLPKY